MSHRAVWPDWPRSVSWLLLLAAFLSVAEADDPVPPLVLAVHPYLPANEIRERFSPLAVYLGQSLGQPVDIRVGEDYPSHIKAIGTDQVDIAYMGPAPYVAVVRNYGPKPILARLEINGQPYFDGYIVTRVDSPVMNLADLKGKSFAFGDRESTMGHQVPHYLLSQAGVSLKDLHDYRFLGAHKNVALAVLAGDVDAGAVKDEFFTSFEKQGLRALAKTPLFSEHLFVTRANLPVATQERLRAALLSVKDAADGHAIMHAINPNLTALVPARDSDYDNLRTVIDTLAALKE